MIYSLDLHLLTHQEHLSAVLKLLQDHQLVVNRKKCSFGMSQVEYLGHVVSAAGVAADPAKIEAVAKWPVPADL